MMENEYVTISAQKLAEIVGGIYFSCEDEDLSSTEDLISYLENHPEQSVMIALEE